MPASRVFESAPVRSKDYSGAIFFLVVAIPVFFISYFAIDVTTASTKDKHLILSCVVFRHGDRTPSEFYNNDPYKNMTYWPEGLGALTKKGKQNSFRLGQFMRLKYQQLLPEIYSSNDIYVISSDNDRCLMTAQLVLAGLYPPKGSQVWQPGFNWQPIPVHTTPRHLDQLIVVKKPCKKYEKEFAMISELLPLTAEEISTLVYLTNVTGSNVSDVFAAERIYDTLEIEEEHELLLPNWAVLAYPQPLRSMAMKSLASFTHTKTLKRLKGGPLLKDIASKMMAKVNGTLKPNRRLFLYSAHDLTIVSFLRTMGINEMMKPDPLATVFLELYEDRLEKKYLIEVWYKNGTAAYPILLHLPSCPNPCVIENFVKNNQELMPDNWDKDCKLV